MQELILLLNVVILPLFIKACKDYKEPVVIQNGTFRPKGFEEKSGKVLDENDKTQFADVAQPIHIVLAGDQTYYLPSYLDGTISKLTY